MKDLPILIESFMFRDASVDLEKTSSNSLLLLQMICSLLLSLVVLVFV